MFEYYRGHEIERPKYKTSLYAAELRRKKRLKTGDEPNSKKETEETSKEKSKKKSPSEDAPEKEETDSADVQS